jgi:hypothetical protein
VFLSQQLITCTATLLWHRASNWLYCHFLLTDSIQLALPSLYVDRQHPIGSTATLCWQTASSWLYSHFTLTDSTQLAQLPLYIKRQHPTGSSITLRWETASDRLYCHFMSRDSTQVALLSLSHCKMESVKLHCHLQTYRQEWNAALQVSNLQVPTNLYTYNLQLKNSQFWYSSFTDSIIRNSNMVTLHAVAGLQCGVFPFGNNSDSIHRHCKELHLLFSCTQVLFHTGT